MTPSAHRRFHRAPEPRLGLRRANRLFVHAPGGSMGESQREAGDPMAKILDDGVGRAQPDRQVAERGSRRRDPVAKRPLQLVLQLRQLLARASRYGSGMLEPDGEIV